MHPTATPGYNPMSEARPRFPKHEATFSFRGMFSKILRENNYVGKDGHRGCLITFAVYVYAGKHPTTNMSQYHWFDVSVTGTNAELIRSLAPKTFVSLSGTVKQELWETKTGEKRKTIRFYANQVIAGDNAQHSLSAHISHQINASHHNPAQDDSLL